MPIYMLRINFDHSLVCITCGFRVGHDHDQGRVHYANDSGSIHCTNCHPLNHYWDSDGDSQKVWGDLPVELELAARRQMTPDWRYYPPC